MSVDSAEKKCGIVSIFRGRPDLSSLLILPGEWVVIKPNLVKESKENDASEWRCVLTDGALIRQVCEYACERLEGSGRVTICDAPQTDSSFVSIAARLGLHRIARECSARFGIEVEVVDLRAEEWVNQGGIISERRKLAGDPRGSVRFDLGRQSLFFGHPGEGHYYGADYDSRVVNNHHAGEKQEYLICGTPIHADVFINMPKLKTHKKTGVTLSLKNLVGINADKNWLPHHTEGSIGVKGDESPDSGLWRSVERASVHFARSVAMRVPMLGPHVAQRMRRAGVAAFGSGEGVIRSGNWFGNDTTWRMVLDLNRCLFFGTADGRLGRTSRKRYYSVVDGVVGMEGAGPMQGDPVRSNVVIVGTDPVAVDAVGASVMGFDWRKVPMIREAFRQTDPPITELCPSDIFVRSDVPEWNLAFHEFESLEICKFRPHFGWAGAIEK